MDILTFSAGPAKLPRDVLHEVKEELLSFKQKGLSILEMSHRSSDYAQINNSAQTLLRELLGIPENYTVLFMAGGGTALFSAIPLNLMGRSGTADYVVTGTWSKQAAREAEKYGEVRLVLPKGTEGIPDCSEWSLNPQASYLYYCSNETISGTEFHFIPDSKEVPIVCDMSSNFLSSPVDVSKFGIIFAASQKNFGPAGICVVIIRQDLIAPPLLHCPILYDFLAISKSNSIYNTPPTFVVYFIEKVFKWIVSQGGLKEMERRSIEKSSLLYSIIDGSGGFYRTIHSTKTIRSRMNVVFKINEEILENEFLDDAKKHGLIEMKGHRSIGGLRISIYNAITIEDTQKVAKFMNDFKEKHQKL